MSDLTAIDVLVDRTSDLKTIEAEPFDAFTVHPAGVAVYHLGTTAPPAKAQGVAGNEFLSGVRPKAATSPGCRR
jgi:hypothetical protein